MDKATIAVKINQLNEGGLLDHLLFEMKKDIALEIVDTQPEDVDKRERLYMLTKALKRLEEKFQECANIY